MALQGVTFEDFSGGVADRYIGTDITRASVLQNFLIDETKKPYVRYGTSIYPTRIPGAYVPSGVYMGPEPFSHPVVINGPSAYSVNEISTFTEISGTNTTFLPTKGNEKESALIWRRQLVAASPTTSVPPSLIYATVYSAPSAPATPATYAALTIGLPAVATSPTIPYNASDAFQALYQFFYKYTYMDYTGTLFAFFGNPDALGFINGSVNDAAGPSSTNISITNIPALANTSYTNYDVSRNATTNTTYTADSTTATVASATGLVRGMQLINANVTQGTVITNISGTTITLSQPAISSAAASSTVFSTLTVQIYRTINGGSVLFYLGMVANGTTSFTDNVSDTNLQLQQTIYTTGGALGYDQPPTGAIAVAQTNDFFWYATNTTLYQSVQGAPGGCPSSFSDQIDQKIIGLSDVISFPILFCDKSVYRVEGVFDSFGNNGFVLREISKTAGCIAKNSIVKTPYGLVWFGNGGIYATDGYTVKKLTRHLNTSYAIWANSKSKGEYDPSVNMVYWTINTVSNPNGNNNAWLVLHLSYGLSEESVFSTLLSETNLYPTSLCFSQSKDIYDTDPLVSTTGTWSNASTSLVVASASGLSVGMKVTGIGISYGTTISAISGTTITLSKATNEAGAAGTAVSFSRTTYSQFYSRMAFTDVNGYLLWFDPLSLADVLIDTNLYPTQMVKKTIMYDFTTAGLDQGLKGFRKWTSDVVLEVDAATPVAMQIKHRRDDGGGWSGDGGTPPSGKGVAGSPGGGSNGNPGVPEIRQDGALTWQLTDCTWGTDANEHDWNDFGTVSGKRSVPAGQLRASRRQLKFTNAFTNIANSDTLGTATVALQATSPYGYAYVTLDTVGQIWPTDPEGYWITFVGDNYTQTFQIKSRYSDTILFILDPLVQLTAGSQKWVIKGYRKFERPRILNFTLNAEIDGNTFGQATTPVGSNA
jgi:hypothetical protein